MQETTGNHRWMAGGARQSAGEDRTQSRETVKVYDAVASERVKPGDLAISPERPLPVATSVVKAWNVVSAAQAVARLLVSRGTYGQNAHRGLTAGSAAQGSSPQGFCHLRSSIRA